MVYERNNIIYSSNMHTIDRQIEMIGVTRSHEKIVLSLKHIKIYLCCHKSIFCINDNNKILMKFSTFLVDLGTADEEYYNVLEIENYVIFVNKKTLLYIHKKNNKITKNN